MISSQENGYRSRLQPPSYLYEVRNLLRDNEKDVWEWFRSEKQTVATRESVKLDLLKSTVRVEPDSAGDLYDLANKAGTSLGLEVPLTIYQAKQTGQFNASISCDPQHAHLVLQGDLSERLDPDEMLAVFGHELSHLLLWNMDEGDFLTTANILIALGQDPSSSSARPIHLETLRLFSQYTEVFCDRGAMVAAGNLQPVVSSLIKIITGVKSVQVKDYQKQSEEIFAKDTNEGSAEITHPELYIRARALDLWQNANANANANVDADADAEQEIIRMVQGKLSLDRMDLCRQENARELTRELIDGVLKPDWMRCEATLSQAQLYFADYKPGRFNRQKMADSLSEVDKDFLNYLVFVMLDFVTADRDLLEPALAYTIGLADAFGIRESYVDAARKELRLRKKQIKEIESTADELAGQASKRADQTASDDSGASE